MYILALAGVIYQGEFKWGLGKRALSPYFGDLTPFVPLSFKGEGEEILERGEAPLFLTLPLPLTNNKGRGLGG